MRLQQLLIAQAFAFQTINGISLVKLRDLKPELRQNAVKKAALYGPIVLKGKDVSSGCR
jgi:hypothetical protein